MQDLDQKVLDYQRCGRGLDRLVASISTLIYEYPRHAPGHSEEDGAELLLRFYPRIRRLIERYEPAGSSFTTYLRASLRWQLRSIARTRVNGEIRARVANAPGTTEQINGELSTPPSFVDSVAENHTRVAARADTTLRSARSLPANRPSVLRLAPPRSRAGQLAPGEAQRLLFLLLKSADVIEPSMIGKIARVVGCDENWLASRYEELSDRLYCYRGRQDRFRQQRDRAWFALRCVEDRLAGALPPERERLQERRDRLHERYVNAREALRRSSHRPTHEQIAEVLGICKGTVDSSVFKGRHELRSEAYRERLAALVEQS